MGWFLGAKTVTHAFEDAPRFNFWPSFLLLRLIQTSRVINYCVWATFEEINNTGTPLCLSLARVNL